MRCDGSNLALNGVLQVVMVCILVYVDLRVILATQVATERGWAIVSAKNGGSKAIKPNYYIESDEHVWLHSRDKLAALQLDKGGPIKVKLVFSEHGFYEILNLDTSARVKCDDLFNKGSCTDAFKVLTGGPSCPQHSL